MSELDEWDGQIEDRSITTAQLDYEVTQLQAAKLVYEEAKAKSDASFAVYDQQRTKLVNILTAANKKSYKVDGVGLVTVKEQAKVQTPKTPEEKAELFKWLKEEMGAEGFLTYATVNHAQINSLHKLKSEEYAEKGINFTMPGVGLPTTEKILSFTRSK